MKVFGVCGVTQSGKTTTIERIIGESCARGYRVGSVKEIHNETFAIDPDASSNTRRHRAAGAELVCARGLNETDFLFPSKLPMPKILSLYDGCDYVVLEGVADIPVPVITTAHTEKDLKEKLSPHTFCISGRIAESIKDYNGIPAVDAVSNAAAITDLIESKVKEYEF